MSKHFYKMSCKKSYYQSVDVDATEKNNERFTTGKLVFITSIASSEILFCPFTKIFLVLILGDLFGF